MKNRSKMILGLASMLGISAGATAVSGFAWFTTQRTANMSLGTYKVGAGDGSIKLAAVTNSEINVANYGVSDHGCSITPASGDLADVSSAEGKTFYKAYIDPTTNGLDKYVEENKAISNKAWKSVVNANQMVCVRWEVEVSNTTAGTNLNVYLSHSGELFKGVTTGIDATTYSQDATASQSLFELDAAGAARATSIVSVKTKTGNNAEVTKNEGEDFTITKENGKIKGITFKSDKLPATNDVVTISYIADYSEYYRLAVIDSTNSASESLVMLYSNSAHAKYVTGTTDTNVAGGGTLAADSYVSESEMSDISKTTDSAAVTTTPTAGDQLLIKQLGSTAKKLKFVVWCEGTGTPLEAVKSNAVTCDFTLVGLTA